jgi:hypothetical protein
MPDDDRPSTARQDHYGDWITPGGGYLRAEQTDPDERPQL